MAGPAFVLGCAGEAATLPFGGVAQGKSLSYILPIYNNGTAPLVITAVTLTADPGTPSSDFVIQFFSGSLTVAPNATDTSLAILFQPTAPVETQESAQLVFTSNSVYGVQQFQVTGTCALLPTSGNYNPTPTSCTSTTSIPSGSATNYSTAVVFPTATIPSGSSVSVTYSYSGNASTIGNAEGQAFTQYSTDGGTTWQTAGGGWGGNTSTSFSGAQSITLGTLLTNLNQLQMRAGTTVTVNPTGNPMNLSMTLSGFTATISSGGDSWVQVSQQWGGTATLLTFPSQNMGELIIGHASGTQVFDIHNPTNAPVTVTFTFAPEYSHYLTGGSGNPIPPGGDLLVSFAVVPQRKGSIDDTAAVTVQAAGSSFSSDIEILYQTPILVSSYTLSGNREATVLALATTSAPAAPFYFTDSLPCEDQCTLARQYYLDQPQLNKNLNRVWLLYERLGVVGLQLTMGVTNPKGAANPTELITLSQQTDGLLDIAVFSLQLTGSMIAFVYQVDQTSTLAPLSIVGFVFKAEEGGEVIEGT